MAELSVEQKKELEIVERFHTELKKIDHEVRKIIVGQKDVVDQVMISMLTGGHSIITGVPGLAKTLLIATVAQVLHLDFKRIQFPLSWFVTFAALTYLIFGAGMYMLFESHVMRRIRNLAARGLICGIIAGFSLFMIATIVNISLTSHLSTKHLMVDCIWQMSEQIVGAMVVVALKYMIHEPQFEHA